MNVYLILLLLGAVLVIEGLPYFLMPSKIKSIYEIIRDINETSLRLIAAIMIIIGFVIIFLVKDKVCF